MKTGKTKESQVLGILRDACMTMAPLDLRIVGDKTEKEYESRFLGLEEYEQTSAVTIEAPAFKNDTILIPLDQEVEIFFSHNNQPHMFVTLVSGHGKFCLTQRNIIPSTELLVPHEILSQEKRSFYRIRADKERPIEVKLSVLADEEEEIDRVRTREKGIITNLGGDGLGFRMLEGRSLLLNIGTRVQLKLRLQPDDEELRLLAQVRYRLRRPKAREVFFGVQFIDIDSNVKYKRSVDSMLRFIAEEQRRHLAQRSHRKQ